MTTIISYLDRAIDRNPELNLRRKPHDGGVKLVCGELDIVEIIPRRDSLFSVADLASMLRKTREIGPSAVTVFGDSYTSWVTSESQVISETAKRIDQAVDVLKADFPVLRALGLV